MNLIGLLLTLIFATILVCMLIDFEIRNKTHLYWLGLFVLFMIVLDAFFLLTFGYETFMKYYTFLAQIPLYIAFIFISKYRGIKLLFIHLTVIALISSIVLIALMIASYFALNQFYMSLIVLVLYILSGFITYKYFRPYVLYMLRNTDKGWLSFCIIPLTYTVLTYTYNYYNTGTMLSEDAFRPIIRGLIFALVSYVMILWLFRQTREQLALQNEQKLLQMQIIASQHNLEALKESQEKTIIYRHDMRHHLNLINAYLMDNNKEAAQNYISEVEKTIDNMTVDQYCNNYSLNLIMNFYITKAKQQHISVKTQMDFPTHATVSDMDLCLVFSNAIENALNALTNIQRTEDKTLEILCKTKNNKLYIEITNPFEGNIILKDKMPVSMQEHHGYGTKSIAAIAEKYKGLYDFTVEDKKFKLRIIL